MTDVEVICAWMEPDAPENGGTPNVDNLKKYSPKGWWRYWSLSCNWKRPILISCERLLLLGFLHEVEEKLSEDQWEAYAYRMMDPAGIQHTRFLLHATAEQKIKALAEVLRSEVEK
jgi:hypothetical protein